MDSNIHKLIAPRIHSSIDVLIGTCNLPSTFNFTYKRILPQCNLPLLFSLVVTMFIMFSTLKKPDLLHLNKDPEI